MRAIAVLSLVVAIFALIISIVAVATPGWLDDGRGVFLSCNGTLSIQTCSNVLGDDKMSFVTSILLLIGIVSIFCGLIFFIVFIKNNKKNFGLSAGVIYAIAVAGIVVGGTVFTVGYINQTTVQGGVTNFGYSYYLAWGSAALCIIASVTSCFDSLKGSV
ncbi:uncharacterized protein LOC100186803 [Ciona intestinalis]